MKRVPSKKKAVIRNTAKARKKKPTCCTAPETPWRRFINAGQKYLSRTTIILIVIAIILRFIPIDRRFSSEITSKKVNIALSKEAFESQITLTMEPFLKSLTVYAQKMELATSEFHIVRTDDPKFEAVSDMHSLKAISRNSTYYRLENIGKRTLPVLISFRPDKTEKTPIIELEYQEKEGKAENILTMELPAGKASLDLSTKRILLRIHESDIEYGPENSNKGQLSIEGEPHKIDVTMESAEDQRILLCAEKGTTYDLSFDDSLPPLITVLKFIEVDPKSMVYPDKEYALSAKDKYPRNPDIRIEAKIEEVAKSSVTAEGIYVNMSGKYGKIRIAQTLEKNTALDEAIMFLKKIWPFVKKDSYD